MRAAAATLVVLACFSACFARPAPASEGCSEVSSSLFGIRLRARSTCSGGGASSARRMPSDRELARAPHTCPSCERDANGRMKVLSESQSDFLRTSGYPYGRAGYVVDYVVPLQCGGDDAASNMRWRPVADAKAATESCQK